MPLNKTSELIEDIRQGRMVILMDDEDREMKVISSLQLHVYVLKILILWPVLVEG